MKKQIITAILAAIIAAGSTLMAQDQPEEYLGLPGDNLNLYAVMKLFQESETIEGFERSLNDENSRINNLDLNGDNQIDYIRVTDYVDGDVHNIVLQAVLGRNESQDVAVFTVQRFADGSVQIQLTGDDALYGKNYIIEPNYDGTPNPGYTGGAYRGNVAVVRTTTIQVAAWPIVRFMFLPGYLAWRSSWYWGFYPVYWHPWHPFFWHFYYGYHSRWYPDYYGHYRRWDYHRYARWNDFYYHGRRVYDPGVTVRINNGSYRTTYSHPDERKRGEELYLTTYKDHASHQSVTPTQTSSRRIVNSSANGRSNPSGAYKSTRPSYSPAIVNHTNDVRRASGDNLNNKSVERSQPAGNTTIPQNRSTGTLDNSRKSQSDVSAVKAPGTGLGRRIESTNTRRDLPVNASPSARRSIRNSGTVISTNPKNNNSTKSVKKDSGKPDNPSRRK